MRTDTVVLCPPQAFPGRRTLEWQSPGEVTVPPPAAETATAAALVQAFLSGNAAADSSFPGTHDSALGIGPSATSETAFLAPQPAAAVGAAPAPAEAGSGRPALGSYSSYRGAGEDVWSQGRAEVSAAAPVAAEAMSQSEDESAGQSICAGLQGDPSEWLRSGGAKGYLCAMQVGDGYTLPADRTSLIVLRIPLSL